MMKRKRNENRAKVENYKYEFNGRMLKSKNIYVMIWQWFPSVI